MEKHRGQIAVYAAYSVIILTLDACAQEQNQQHPGLSKLTARVLAIRVGK